MALRKFVFLNPSEGYIEEQQPTDQLNLGKATFSGISGVAIDAGNQLISNVASPVSASDATNKSYVDALVQGISWKNPVRAATTGVLPAVTYANGASGVGATLTENANGALPAQDGITLVNGDRLLVKDQAAQLQNGIYVVTDAGSAGTPFILTRALDDDISAEQDAAAVFITSGTVQSDSAYVQTTDLPITMGTTALVWVLFTSTSSITASTGLIKVGNDIRVKKGDGIEVVSNGASTNVDISGSNPGLRFAGASPNGTLEVKPDTTQGIDKGSGGVFAKTLLAAGTGFDGGGNIAVAPYANGGIQNSANGLQLKLDGTTLVTSVNGVKVDHAPELVKQLTAASNIAAFSAVYISANNVVAQGANTADNPSRIVGVAKAAITTGNTGDVTRYGVITGALSGATAGAPYYMGPTGLPILYASLASAARVIRLGWAYNATDLFVDVQDIGKKA